MRFRVTYRSRFPLLTKLQLKCSPINIGVVSALLIFLVLVISGVTGSSLRLGLNYQHDFVDSDSSTLLGRERAIRSDEWIVLTPMAIAQTNHKPRFPVINRNLGPDGQNMLIAGMTGVPVDHVSSLSKPATWGFFLFDLRRALAWNWWFPIFGCLFALWWAISIINPGKPVINFLASSAFVTSSYTVAWSNWPAYAVFFPAITLCLSHKILSFNTSRIIKLVLSFFLGLSIPGFLFILYPAWQVPLAYLFCFIFISIFVDQKLWRRLNNFTIFCFIFAFSLSAYIIYCWWLDAGPAIKTIQQTVYPGQRSLVLGGGFDLWQFFRGFINNHSMFYEGSTQTNASESASFFYFFPIIFIYFCFASFGRLRISIIEWALFLFCALVVVYQFLGFPSAIAEFSLWGRSLPQRADIALGLASIIICTVWVSRKDTVGLPSKSIAVLISAFYSLVILLSLDSAPAAFFGNLQLPTLLVGVPVVFCLGFWLMRRQSVKFFIALVLWNSSIYVFFNPLVIAPSYVSSNVLSVAPSDRVLTIGGSYAMWLLAAGVPIYNGVFYYPQKGIWSTFDPNGKMKAITNRYQHLFFELGEPAGKGEAYNVSSPQADIVKIIVSPDAFDFGDTAAAFVVGPESNLKSNQSLKLIESVGARGIFRILGD